MRLGLTKFITVLVATLLLSGACTPGEPDAAWVEGEARFPDDQGIATDVTFDRIRLDDERGYDVPRDIQSFSTYNGDVVPLVSLEGRYVQIGERQDGLLDWVASIGVVQDSEPPTVIFNGIVKEIRDKDIVFQDGTVLKISGIAEEPEGGRRYKATIHTGKKQIIELTEQ